VRQFIDAYIYRICGVKIYCAPKVGRGLANGKLILIIDLTLFI